MLNFYFNLFLFIFTNDLLRKYNISIPDICNAYPHLIQKVSFKWHLLNPASFIHLIVS